MPKTLLLADDSLTIQKVVGITFAGEDVKLVTVDNGDDALERARDVRPELVLADVTMPGLNGYELCRAIQRDPELSGTPVLLLTGTFETFDGGRAREVGASGHITKPFEARALIAQVNALIARGRQPKRSTSDASSPRQDVSGDLGSQIDPADLELPAKPGLGWSGAGAEISLEDLEGSPGAGEELELEDPLGVEPEASEPELEEPDFDAMGLDGEEASFESAVTDPPDLETLDPLSEERGPEAPSPRAAADDSMARTALFRSPQAGSGGRTAPAEDPGAPDLPWVDSAEEEPDPGAAPELPEADALFEHPVSRRHEPPSLEMEPGDDPLDGPVVEAQPTIRGVSPVLREAMVVEDARSKSGADHKTGRTTGGQARSATAPPAVALDRDAMRDMLEKVAWEAFSSLSEQVVHEVVKKVEEIAWEAIPAVAERLVREEIARLKDDSKD